MALQLGVLRDALLSAGVEGPAAAAASEEVAGYENRLTRLSTQMQIVIGVLLLLGSQAALWAEYGRMSSQISELQSRSAQIIEQNAKLAEQYAKLADQNAQIISQLSHISGTSH